MGHEKLMAICHSRCCFGPKQWSAKWFNIFEIIRQRDMTFHNGALATYILSTDLPKFWNSSLSDERARKAVYVTSLQVSPASVTPPIRHGLCGESSAVCWRDGYGIEQFVINVQIFSYSSVQ